jgi:iron complex outermembrane recepter protein
VTRTRPLLIFGALAGGVLSATAAQAQTGAAGDDSDSNQPGQLQQVTVTAERRSERLQSVPIDIGVVTEADAAKFGVTSNMALEATIPSYQASRQLTGATLYMRGIGSIAAPGVENAVATYLDDVYVNGYSSTIVAFNNVERIEVLKGPQGTLFGRNATGGVIHIVTKDPSSTTAVNLQAGYSNYNTISTNLYATTGIGSNLAMDIAYMSREQRQGYGRDLTTGQEISLGKEYGISSKLKWTPTDSTTVLLAADHYWDDYDYGMNQTSLPGTLSAGNGTFAGNYNTEGNNLYSPYGPGRSGHDRHIDGVSLTVKQDLGWAELKSITARRATRDYTSFDQDGGPLHYNDARWPSNYEQYSEEVHLSSVEGATLFGRQWHWLGGLYALKANDGTSLSTSGLLLGGGDLYVGSSIAYTRSYAAFFDSTLEILPATNLTLGVRETADRIHNRSNTIFTGFGSTFVTEMPELTGNATKPTYRVVLDHSFTDDLMVYGSVSRGFKSGGFSLFGPGTPATQPETVDAFALGTKTSWLNRRLQFNTEAFDYNYKNQQVQVIKSGSLVSINAAKSHIYGIDGSITALPTEDLTVSANFGYLHGRYTSFQGAPIYLQNPATCSPTPQRLPGDLQPGSTLCSFDASGKPTIRSPTFSGNVGFDYTLLRGDHGTFNLAANYNYVSSFNWDISGQYPESAYGLLSSSIMWTSPSARFDVQFYCTNCTDKFHHTYIAESGPEQQMAPADPRLYGIRVGVHL